MERSKREEEEGKEHRGRKKIGRWVGSVGRSGRMRGRSTGEGEEEGKD